MYMNKRIRHAIFLIHKYDCKNCQSDRLFTFLSNCQISFVSLNEKLLDLVVVNRWFYIGHDPRKPSFEKQSTIETSWNEEKL